MLLVYPLPIFIKIIKVIKKNYEICNLLPLKYLLVFLIPTKSCFQQKFNVTLLNSFIIYSCLNEHLLYKTIINLFLNL